MLGKDEEKKNYVNYSYFIQLFQGPGLHALMLFKMMWYAEHFGTIIYLIFLPTNSFCELFVSLSQ